AGLRVHTDIRNEKIGYKIREHSAAKVPFILAVGGREAEAGTVALRRLGSDGQTILDYEEAMRQLALESCPPDLKTGNA
ncbi:MAG: His/Gly/Thr/Pro-type tRNA ligase C-terminal domain-containing protein, partial [Candidatus Puniceispirillaceae bacterium]